jgi:hypothetical protein
MVTGLPAERDSNEPKIRISIDWVMDWYDGCFKFNGSGALI